MTLTLDGSRPCCLGGLRCQPDAGVGASRDNPEEGWRLGQRTVPEAKEWTRFQGWRDCFAELPGDGMGQDMATTALRVPGLLHVVQNKGQMEFISEALLHQLKSVGLFPHRLSFSPLSPSCTSLVANLDQRFSSWVILAFGGHLAASENS